MGSNAIAEPPFYRRTVDKPNPRQHCIIHTDALSPAPAFDWMSRHIVTAYWNPASAGFQLPGRYFALIAWQWQKSPCVPGNRGDFR
jgi:hypothetical protein